ncbi:MAG: hypothetical protein OXK72_07805 [Gammaproteobacteria bacterium]|nr:hypothetical protein [Gammaproteobacteria bacterium]MDE0410883.1 hypothetical protein [Gammaproteobacteria bacterium]
MRRIPENRFRSRKDVQIARFTYGLGIYPFHCLLSSRSLDHMKFCRTCAAMTAGCQVERKLA